MALVAHSPLRIGPTIIIQFGHKTCRQLFLAAGWNDEETAQAASGGSGSGLQYAPPPCHESWPRPTLFVGLIGTSSSARTGGGGESGRIFICYPRRYRFIDSSCNLSYFGWLKILFGFSFRALCHMFTNAHPYLMFVPLFDNSLISSVGSNLHRIGRS